MIADTLEALALYRGLHPGLDRGLEALVRLIARPSEEDGRLELEGEALYASLSTYRTAAQTEKSFEAHRRYIDLQVVLAGRETLHWAPLDRLSLRGDYAASDDIAFYSGRSVASVRLEPGSFVVLFPQDAHKPGCHPGGGGGATVRKLVIKVRV